MTIPKGKTRLVAYPVGTQYFYEITRRWHYLDSNGYPSGRYKDFTTGNLMAFNPAANAIDCYVF